jgi:hypothetical protein
LNQQQISSHTKNIAQKKKNSSLIKEIILAVDYVITIWNATALIGKLTAKVQQIFEYAEIAIYNFILA